MAMAQQSGPVGMQDAMQLIEQSVLEAHAESLRAQGLRVDAVIFSDAIFNEPLPQTRRMYVYLGCDLTRYFLIILFGCDQYCWKCEHYTASQ
jgi:hypothetical protein